MSADEDLEFRQQIKPEGQTFPPPLISATHLQKVYRSQGVSVNALNDVSLEIQRGEIIAIMGASGSGKSTLLNCLAGLDTVDSGTIIIDAMDITRLNDAERTNFRARTMGFIFQNFNLVPVLNAVENVELPLLILRKPVDEARLRAREMLSLVGLSEREQHHPNELSGGQQQRVAIARALIARPAIVWADEPTGNLDSEMAETIMDLLVELNRTQGQTLVIVTHAPDIGQRAHRILHMRDGQIDGQL